MVTDHRKPIPKKPDGTVDYFGYFKDEKPEHWTEKFNWSDLTMDEKIKIGSVSRIGTFNIDFHCHDGASYGTKEVTGIFIECSIDELRKIPFNPMRGDIYISKSELGVAGRERKKV